MSENEMEILEDDVDVDDPEDDDDIELGDEDLDDELDDELADDLVDDDLVDDEVLVVVDDEPDDEDDDSEDEDDDDETEESLDQILAHKAKAERATAKRTAKREDDEVDLIDLLIPSVADADVEPLKPVVIPVKEDQEFVCSHCHLVKNRSQMMDPKRGLCRDCV